VTIFLERQTLRERIGSELLHILRFYVVIAAVLVALVSLGFGYAAKRADLKYNKDLIATKLGAEMAGMVRDIEGLVSLSEVIAGLRDSEVRDAYLVPVMERVNRSEQQHLMLLDDRGRFIGG
jgi:hypothetical protein